MDNYKYTLTYQCDDKTLTYTFNADIGMTELKEQIKYFLRGCSWSDLSLSFLEEDPEETIESSIKSDYYDWAAEYIEKAENNNYKADKILKDIRDKFL